MERSTRLATIDIGTNSVLMLAAELVPRGPAGRVEAEVLEETCTITRLGQGVDHSGRLDPVAVQRTLRVLQDHADLLSRLGIGRRAAVGTSALRDATNREVFIEPARSILGCPVEVASGRREAELTLAGVLGSLGELAGPTLLLDVGGGSTELILAQGSRVEELRSLELGAVRLTERLLWQVPAAEPVPAPAVRALRETVREALCALPRRLFEVERVIGTAGTVTTLASVNLGLGRYDTRRVNGLVLSREDVTDQIDLYARLPLDRRRQIRGLEPARADVILAGACIVAELLACAGASELSVCDRGLRWGLFWEMARTGAP